MPILIVSDVHANLAALRAVIADASRDGAVDAIWATGDLVGYGAEPGEALELLREHRLVAVAGNHDLAACGKIVGSSRVDLQACKLEYSIVSPK